MGPEACFPRRSRVAEEYEEGQGGLVRDDRPLGLGDARDEVRIVPRRNPRRAEGRDARHVRGWTPAIAGPGDGNVQRRTAATLGVSSGEEDQDPGGAWLQPGEARADRARRR